MAVLLPPLHRVLLALMCCVCLLARLATPIPLPTDTPKCTAAGDAHYSLTFTGKWTQAAFPKQYPIFRPPAQWSTLIGVSHSADYHMWRRDDFASNGVREFTEKAEAWTLMKEVEEAGQRIQSALGVFSAPAMPGGSGQTSAEFEVFARNSYLSFMVRIVPSPDWFVGMDSLDLCEGDQWKESITLELFPYDAGTDSGFTFSSPNYETIPQDKVMQITSSFPSHPANSFFYPRLKSLPPIAKVTLTKIKKTNQIISLPVEPTHSNQLPTDNEIEESFIKTPLDCEVSAWSPWGLCKGKCGDSGARHRTRYVLMQSANHGAVCPLLEEEKKCTLENCL